MCMKADPRCLDVPKATRRDGAVGSGLPEEYAVTNCGTLTSIDGRDCFAGGRAHFRDHLYYPFKKRGD